MAVDNAISEVNSPRMRKAKSMQMLTVALRMPQLRIAQLTLLTSLTFGAFVALCSAPVAAQTQQDSSTPIPSLSGYDSETRQSIELACIVKKSDGPVAYGTCLDRQIASLQGSSGIPSLARYDRETRQSIERACIVKKSDGPVAYGACLNQQIASLKGSSSSSSPSGTEGDMRQAELPTSTSREKRPDTETSQASALHLVDPMSRFTSENVLKVHQGMSSNKILEMFGAPRNVSQAVCGASVGKPWACTTWEYGDVPYEWASFTFAGRSGSLILNSFDVHRK